MKDLIKKWWFWIIILAIIIIISFVVIVLMGFSLIKGEVGNVAMEIQQVYSDATIYTSAGNNTLVLELKNWNNNEYELSKIAGIIKSKIYNGELKQYSKLIIYTFLNTNGKESLFIKDEYSLPNFTKLETKSYITYEDYKKMYDTLDQTMNSYTNLYNSIY